MYILVEFIDTKTCGIIPKNWREGNHCALWPPRHLIKPGFINKAVMDKMPPDDSWPSYPIRELYISKTYEKARSKLAESELISDLASSTEPESDTTGFVSHKESQNKTLGSDEDDSDDTIDEHQVVPRFGAREAGHSAHLLATARRDMSFENSSSPLVISHTSRQTSQTPQPQGVMSARQADEEIPVWALKLIEQVASVFEEQKQTIRELRSLKRHFMTGNGQVETDEQALDFTLPMSSLEDVLEIERRLNDINTERKFLHHLRMIGGATVKEVTANMLSEVFTTPVAIQYNWTGTKSKRAFRTLRLKDIIQRAVRQNRLTATATNAEIKKVIQEWLRAAPDRDGGRKRRSLASASQQNGSS